jgi:hypothetical protein
MLRSFIHKSTPYLGESFSYVFPAALARAPAMGARLDATSWMYPSPSARCTPWVRPSHLSIGQRKGPTRLPVRGGYFAAVENGRIIFPRMPAVKMKGFALPTRFANFPRSPFSRARTFSLT